jgi:hypothetical protein
MKIGATYTGNGKCEFVVWAPFLKKIFPRFPGHPVKSSPNLSIQYPFPALRNKHYPEIDIGTSKIVKPLLVKRFG